MKGLSRYSVSCGFQSKVNTDYLNSMINKRCLACSVKDFVGASHFRSATFAHKDVAHFTFTGGTWVPLHLGTVGYLISSITCLVTNPGLNRRVDWSKLPKAFTLPEEFSRIRSFRLVQINALGFLVLNREQQDRLIQLRRLQSLEMGISQYSWSKDIHIGILATMVNSGRVLFICDTTGVVVLRFVVETK